MTCWWDDRLGIFLHYESVAHIIIFLPIYRYLHAPNNCVARHGDTTWFQREIELSVF